MDSKDHSHETETRKMAVSRTQYVPMQRYGVNKPQIRPVSQPYSHGELVRCSVGTKLTPHIIVVNTGEDIGMKLISLSQQDPRVIHIISAVGTIKSVTLDQPDSSGVTLSYEGLFQIRTLSGWFKPYESGGTRSISSLISVSFASPNGLVLGGRVAGPLVAASPVRLIVGSPMAENQHEMISTATSTFRGDHRSAGTSLPGA